jgi:hypothetical protein
MHAAPDSSASVQARARKIVTVNWTSLAGLYGSFQKILLRPGAGLRDISRRAAVLTLSSGGELYMQLR